MITNPGTNVKFSDEKTQQLEEWQGRLKIVQDEIRISESTKSSLLSEIVLLEKNKDYLKGIVLELEGTVENLKIDRKVLLQDVEASNRTLSQHQMDTKERTTILSIKEAEHTKKSHEILKSEQDLKIKIDTHNKDSVELAKEKLLVERAKELFSVASQSVIWK